MCPVTLILAVVASIVAATAYIRRRIDITVRQAYNAGRVTGYAEGVLERR